MVCVCVRGRKPRRIKGERPGYKGRMELKLWVRTGSTKPNRRTDGRPSNPEPVYINHEKSEGRRRRSRNL